MLYDDYATKIKKIANGKNFIIRHRILITIITSIVVVLTTVFLASKGSLVGNISISNEIIYGEEVTYDAKALFSKVLGYEFKAEGSNEWTNDVPNYVGSYQIRAKVNKGFGKGYSKPQAFSIVKRNLDITINEDEIEYGKYPTFTQRGLLSTDSIDSLEFVFDDLSSNKTFVNPSLDSIKIVDSNNFDVTECYSIIANKKELTFKKRQIELKPEVLSSIYTGEGISYNNSYIITSPNSIGYSDVLEIQTVITDQNGNVVTEAVLPGVYTNTISIVSIMSNGVDVSSNYDIQTIISTIEIKKRPITVVTSSKSKIYDGTDLISLDLGLSTNTSNSLLEGHKLVCDVSNASSIKYYSEEGIENRLNALVYDENNNDISALYDITYEYGNLKIEKKDITVVAKGASKAYDGSYLTNPVVALQSGYTIPEGDSLLVSSTNLPSIKNKGMVENILEAKVMCDDQDISNSYNIKYEYEYLVITPSEIKVKPLILPDYVYNGQAATYSSSVSNYELVSGNIAANEDLIILVEIQNKSGESLTDVGSYSVRGVNYQVNNGLYENYEVIFTEETSFNILKREVIISPLNQNSVFYESFSYPSSIYNSYYIDANDNQNVGFIGNDAISVEAIYKQNGAFITPFNAGKYDILLSNYSFVSGNENNYSIVLSGSAELTIEKRNITIAPKEQSAIVYSNLAYEYPANDYVIVMDNNNSASLEKLHIDDALSISVDIYDSSKNIVIPKNAGTYSIYIKGYDTTDLVKQNYNINLSNSGISFEILKRDLVIEAKQQASIVYDGNSYTYPVNEYVIVSDNNTVCNKTELSDGATFTIDVKYVNTYKYNNEYTGSTELPTDAGKYAIYVNSVSGDLANYNVIASTNPVELVIEQRHITIKPSIQADKVYDGNAYIYPGSKYEIVKDNFIATSSSALIDNSEISIGVEYRNIQNSMVEAINAGEYKIFATTVDGDAKFKNNFIVEFSNEGVAINIIPKSITVMPLYQESVVYDGNEYVYPNNKINVISNDGLGFSEQESFAGLSISVMFMNSLSEKVTPINAGAYKIKATGYYATDLLRNNYDITISNQTVDFTILQKELIIAPKKLDDIIYYGGEFSYPKDQYTFIGDDNPLVNNESIEISVVFKNNANQTVKPKNAGTYYMYVSSVSGDLSNYKVRYYEEGIEFNILKCSVTLAAASINNVIYGEEIVYDSSRFVVVKVNNIPTNTNALIDGSALSINVIYRDENKNIVRPVNAGTYFIDIASHNCDTLTSSNYEFSYSEDLVSFEIVQRSVTISPISPSDKIFDNNIYIYDEKSYLIYDEVDKKYDNTLIKNEDLSIDVIYKQGDTNKEPIHAGSYMIYVNSFVANELTMNNYYIQLSNVGVSFNITKRQVEIGAKAQDAVTYSANEYIYPGNQFSVTKDNGIITNNSYKLIDNTLLNIEVEFKDYLGNKVTPKNAGTYYMFITDHEYSDSEYDDYDISYSTVGIEFVINKKTVKIKPLADSEEIVFTGEEVNYTKNKFAYVNDIDKFISEDTINVETYVLLAPIHAGSYDVYINSATITYNTGDANNYNIICLSGTIDVIPRPITIAPKQQVYAYDANGFTYPTSEFIITLDNGVVCELNALKLGEDFNLNVVFKNANNSLVTPKNAGTYYIYASNYITTEQVKKDYEITLSDECVELVIKAREITVKPVKPTSKVYDGEEFNYNSESFEIIKDNNEVVSKNELIDGYKLYLDVVIMNSDDITVEAKNAGTYYIKAAGYSFENEVVAANYNITLSNEKVEYKITKRKVVISAKQPEAFTYNAELFEYDENDFVVLEDNGNKVNNSQLLTNDLFTVNVKYMLNGTITPAEPKNAGKYDILIDSYYTSELTKDNYEIELSTKPVVLEIYKLNIAIMPDSPNEIGTFSGVVQTLPTISWKYVDLNTLTTNDKQYADNRLLGLDSLTMTAKVKDKELLDAGTYTLELNTDTLVFTGISVDNYNFIYYTSETIMKKAAITIEAVSNDNITYNAAAYSYNGNYKVVMLNGSPVDMDNQLLRSEDITLNVIYALTDINGNKLVDGNGYKYNKDSNGNYCAPKDAGVYYLQAYSIETYDLSVENNYEITFSKELFKVEILKRKIMVAPVEQSKTYDGDAFIYDSEEYGILSNYNAPISDLLSSHKLTINVEFETLLGDIVESAVNAGKYLITISNIQITEGNTDVTSNYEIIDYETNIYLTIDKCDITVETIDKTIVYNGNKFEYSSQDVKITSGSFVKNHSITLKLRYIDKATSQYVVDANDEYIAPTNAGEYLIEIYDHNIQNSLKENYNVVYGNVTKSVLTIKKRDVYCKPYADALTYNFEQQSINLRCVINKPTGSENGLVNGDMFKFDKHSVTDNDGNIVVIKDAGTYYINYDMESLVFTSGLASNYNIIPSQFELKVNPLNIIVKYNGGSKVYDGNSIEIDYYDDFKIVNKSTSTTIDTLEFIVSGLSIKYNNSSIEPDECVNAGQYTIEGTNINITNDLISNFNIEYKKDNYNVTKVDLEVKFIDHEEIYDGNKQDIDYANCYQIISGSVVKNQVLWLYPKFEYKENSSIVLYSAFDESPIHAGEYEIKEHKYEQYKEDGTLEDSLMTNYNIIYIPAIFKINPAEIKLSTIDKSCNYTAEKYTYDSEYIKQSGLTSIDNDTFKFNVYYVDSNDNIVDATEVGDYEIRIDLDSVELYSSGTKSIYKDYVVLEYTENMGTLTINPITVELETHNKTRMWNGTDLYCDEFTCTSNNVIKTQSILVDDKTIIPAYDENGVRLVKATKNNILTFKIIDKNGIDRTSNYILNVTYGVLEIDTKANVSNEHLFDEYFRKPYSGSEIDLLEIFEGKRFNTANNVNVQFSFIPPQGSKVYSDSALTNEVILKSIGTYYIAANLAYLNIYLKNENNGNYEALTVDEMALIDINISNFKLEVFKRTIGIRPKDLVIDYDGNSHYCSTSEFADNINYESLEDQEILDNEGNRIQFFDLILGHNIKIKTRYGAVTFTSSALTKNYITSVSIYDEHGYDVSSNYEIYYSPYSFNDMDVRSLFYARLQIKRIVLEYSTGSTTWTYDGQSHYNDEMTYDSSALLENHIIVIKSKGLTITDATNEEGIDNKVVFDIIDTTTSKSVKKYYDTTSKANYGRLKIEKKTIKIITGSASKEYDGMTLTCQEYKIEGEIVEGQVLEIVFTGELVYVGEADNTIEQPKITSKGGSIDYTHNYEIIVECGTLEITKPKI